MTKIRIIHYTAQSDEYLVLTCDESLDAADFGRPGYDLETVTTVSTQEDCCMLPFDRTLRVEK